MTIRETVLLTIVVLLVIALASTINYFRSKIVKNNLESEKKLKEEEQNYLDALTSLHYYKQRKEELDNLRNLLDSFGINLSNSSLFINIGTFIGCEVQRLYIKQDKNKSIEEFEKVEYSDRNTVIKLKLDGNTLSSIESKAKEKKLKEKFGDNYGDYLHLYFKKER